jgi:hypothetical protein
MTKVIGSIGAIVTSVLVALGVKYSEHFISPAKPQQQVAVVIQHPTNTEQTPASTPAATQAAKTPESSPKIPPDPTKLYDTGPGVDLFNGTDLTGFYSILGDPKETREITPAKPLGKNNDPLHVFSVKGGLLRVSGEVYGCLLTENQHENYLLTVEYRWGEQTFPPRTNLSRNSGILLHCVGPDDAVRKICPQSIRCRIQEGRTGDLRFQLPEAAAHVKRLQRLTVECEDIAIPGPNPVNVPGYKPGAPPRILSGGDIRRLGANPGWRDEKGYRNVDDLEKPGEWNTLECYCFGDTITVRLNGRVLNHATHSAQSKGKIGLFSYKAEIFCRRLELMPLTKKQAP